MTLTIIKGCPRDQWEAVQAAQYQPFLYFASNGSKWMGEAPDDLDELLRMLASHPLRKNWGDHCEVDPCESIPNENCTTPNAPRWINGPHLFAVDGEQMRSVDPARGIWCGAVLVGDAFARIDFAVIAPVLAEGMRRQHPQEFIEVVGCLAHPLRAIRRKVEEGLILGRLHGLPLIAGTAFDDGQGHGVTS